MNLLVSLRRARMAQHVAVLGFDHHLVLFESQRGLLEYDAADVRPLRMAVGRHGPQIVGRGVGFRRDRMEAAHVEAAALRVQIGRAHV